MSDPAKSSTPRTLKLASYLFSRLRQLGVSSVHGVPGDYNLSLLDYVEPAGLHWVGNSNELNAGYAADGYSRIKGLGALVTTFGVGELSALNAIAGAYAELAPVVHIVGTPDRKTQEGRVNVHHTFNDGEYGRFAEMTRHVTVAQVDLRDPRTAPEMVDHALRECLLQSRPVYIQIPVDMVLAPVLRERLLTPITLPPPPPSFDGDDEGKQVDEALDLVLQRMYASKNPMILVDGEARAHGGVLGSLNQLVHGSRWPTWTSGFGKGLVDETLGNVRGVWRGSLSSEEERAYISLADLILVFGPHFSTTNTQQLSALPDKAVSILFESSSIILSTSNNKDESNNGRKIRDLPMRHFLPALLSKLDWNKLSQIPTPNEDGKRPLPTFSTQTGSLDPNANITQVDFYAKLNRLLKPGDIIMGETGTAGYGVREVVLPAGCRLFTPVTWLSIGYMLPAAQGAALAQRELHAEGNWPLPLDYHPTALHSNGAKPHDTEPNGTGGGTSNGTGATQRHPPPRTILLIGDGSFQMTAQELGTIVREQLNVVIVLLNNDGYTIERCLHGWQQPYNDVARWKYLLAPALFGVPVTSHTNAVDGGSGGGVVGDGKREEPATAAAKEQQQQQQQQQQQHGEDDGGGYMAHTFSATTWKELDVAMEHVTTATSGGDGVKKGRAALNMVEVKLGVEDAPALLAQILAKTKEREGVDMKVVP